MTEKLEFFDGVVEAVSPKNLGVKVSGKGWLDIQESQLKYIEKGKAYRIGVKQGTKSIVWIKAKNSNNKSTNRDDYVEVEQKPKTRDERIEQAFKEKMEHFKEKDRQVRRLALLNTAIEFLKLKGEKVNDENSVVRVAELFEEWVLDRVVSNEKGEEVKLKTYTKEELEYRED